MKPDEIAGADPRPDGNQGLVSIYVPAYNAEKYLAATLASLLAQTYRHFEVVVVNDGSTDRTRAIAGDFAARDGRIRVVDHPQNRGITATRNTGWASADPAARYILGHDSDDISLPSKLQALVEYLEAHPEVDGVGCFAEYFNDQNQVLGNPPIEWEPARIRATFGTVNSMIISATLGRRKMYEAITPFRPYGGCVDYDFWARALLDGFTLANIPTVLHRIRVHAASMGATQRDEMEQIAGRIRQHYNSQAPRGETAAGMAPGGKVPAPAGPPESAGNSRWPGRAPGFKALDILHTVEFYAPHTGGAEIVVQQLSERLVRRGHRVTVATTHLPERASRELNGVVIEEFAVAGRRAHGCTGEVARYQEFLRAQPADILMNYAAQVWPSDLAFDLLAGSPPGRASILAPCGYSALTDERTLRWPDFRGYFEKDLPDALLRYDAVVYHSGIYKDFLFGQALKLTNGLVIPNGTDEAEFTRPAGINFREKYRLATPLVGLCVANYFPDKGQERIIECVRQMHRPDFTMVFIGKEGGRLAALRQQAEGLNVRFLVAPPREDTVAAFRSADVFLFGSHIEASPLVIIEAKAARLPFVSTDCGNVREWKGGIVCAPAEMAPITSRLLDDSAWRRRLADEGWQEWKERLTWEAVTDQWEDLYLRLHQARTGAAAGARRTLPGVRVAPAVSPPAATAAPAGAIVVKLQGGLGNQMFQFAAGLALARRTGAKLKLDLGFLLDRTPRPNFTFRGFDLNLFNLPSDCEVLSQAGHAAAAGLVVFPEKQFHYDPQFEALGTDTYLDGYWQTPRYFSAAADEVRRTFAAFRAPLDAEQQAFAQRIRAHPSVCLNVRRADYVANPVTHAFHGVCAEQYFQPAVRHLLRRVPDAHFYIFSDDVEWCRDADLVSGAPATVVGHEYAGDRFGGYLQLMMACRHFIIPNSTFAWWAAFLGRAPDSLVIAPAPWFSDLSLEFADLLPADWTQLSRNPGRLMAEPAAAPAVSVVVPCYKQAHFLQEAVESVVAQTFSDWELIVVNDGSPDDTSRVARDLIARHPDRRIRLIEKPNGGLADARNTGIQHARGKYILPLDADDRIHPLMLEKAVDVLASSQDIAIAYADQQYFGADRKAVQVAEYDFRRLCAGNYFAYCSLYRREAWVAAGGYRRNMTWGYEDWDFWISCGELGFTGKRIPATLFYYRVKAQSMLTAALAHDDELRSQVVLNHPKLYDEASRDWAAAIGGTKSGPAAAVISREPSAPAPRIIALMSAYNEGDVIHHVIGDLIANGVDVYLVDNCSTDNTVAEAGKWLGRGLLKIEQFPEDAAGPLARCTTEYVWTEILRRKEELSTQLEAAWFLHVDADEFRESPWPGKTLAEAIRQVDRLGYNAINFELLNFRPTDDDFVPGQDVRHYLPAYQPGELFDARQIKAWKNTGVRVQLAANAGHSVGFPGRRVFPLNFILRHYPIRGETHGRRKVFTDRLPRFAREEVACNWHVQYNEFADGRAKFLHDPAALVPYDGARTRAELLGRFSEDLLLANTLSGATTVAPGLEGNAARAWIGRRLALRKPLAADTGTQAEQTLVSLLQLLEQKKELPALQIDPALGQLLAAMLEMKLAHARLAGDSHFTYLGTRLAQILAGKPAQSPMPAAETGAVRDEAPAGEPALVSLCIPTFNGEQFLAATLASALQQSYPAIEIIVSDDRSTDRTVEIAETILADSRFPVRILRHERLGLVGNWSHCISQARGKYIKFLFQDDLLEPDCVAALVAVAESDPEIGLVFSPRRIDRRGDGTPNPALEAAYRDGRDVHKGWTHLAPVQAGRALLQDPRLFQNPINKVGEPSTVLLKKSALEGVGGFDPDLRQLVDVELWLRLMTRYKVGYVDRVLSCFRLHAKQTTQNNLRAGLIAEDWKRFYGKLATDPIYTALSPANLGHARLLFGQLGGVPATAPQAAAAPVDFFDADEVRNIEQLIAAYGENPAGQEVRDQLQALQGGLMKFLVTAETASLERQFQGSFGRVFRALGRSGLSAEPPAGDVAALLATLDGLPARTGKPAEPFDYRPLLARMLGAPAHRGPEIIALEEIPGWLHDDYLGYLLHAPPVFVREGEAEQYQAHMLAVVRSVGQRIQTAPNAALTGKAAAFFATRANFIPLYFSQRNTRELAETRAAILEYFLRSKGAVIDVKLPKRPRKRQKIKVGYLNAHFGAQTETHVTLPTLQLDRSRFEICLFPVAVNPGPVEDHCRSFADSFTPLPPGLDQQVRTIRAAALDVLIIGTNVTAVTNQVLLIASHRLAPLQLVSYCSPVSTGLRHVDGYLTGTLNDLPGLQEHFTEQLHFCEGPPGCLDYSVEAKGSSAGFSRASLGLAPDEVVFVNAAACFKILPEMQETWAKILQAVPRSRLLLLPFNPNWSNAFPVKQFERTLAEACARQGVARERIVLAGSLPSRADVKALEQVADVYLDTFPFSGSISVVDPLELGLPTVVWEGKTHRGRMAAALLRDLDIPELITQDETAYIALAVRLATDAPYRRGLNGRLLAAMARSPRFVNPPAYGQALGELIESLVAVKKRPVDALALA